MIPVEWLNFHPEVCHSPGMWDQATIADLLEPASQPTTHAVVVVPAGFHLRDTDRINEHLSRYEGVVVILTSDEGSKFPWQKLDHPNMRLWIMTPRPNVHAGSNARYLGEYLPPATSSDLKHFEHDKRPLDWFFSGQITHKRRVAAARAMDNLEGGMKIETPGFTQGLPRDDYLKYLARTKVAPCPSGPDTPDSFRLYEALEAGCLPIADGLCPRYEADGYWTTLFGQDPPWPVIRDWKDLTDYVDIALDGWPANANRASAFWQLHKRNLRAWLHADLAAVGHPLPTGDLTVLIPTSPIPSHPSTAVIEETVKSVRFHHPDAEIIVMIDGCRTEQAERRADYDEYVRRLLWKTNHDWVNVTPLLFDSHTHQAAMTRRALDRVDTPLVMFVEHDTPLVTDEPIDWPLVYSSVLDGRFDLVRFHHEALVLDEHRYLMVDEQPRDGLWRTAQWSQRPHVASTAYYRHILDTEFDPTDLTMIEDVMYGVVEEAWRHDRELGWFRHRLAIYSPEGNNIKRSLHTDGRETDDKYPMLHRGRWA